MFLIFGTKKFGMKKTGYKISPCNNCEMPRTVVEWSWKEWAHFFYIPLLPMGTNRSWQCSSCGQDIKLKKGLSMLAKVGIVIILLFFSPIIIFSRDEMELVSYWGSLAFIAVCFWAIINSILSHGKTAEKNRSLNILPLISRERCEICQGRLISVDGAVLRCSDCKCYAHE